MSLWLRVRRTNRSLVTAALVAFAVASIGETYLPLPEVLSGHGLRIPIALVAPLALSTVIGWSLTRGESRLEAVASRPLRMLDGFLILGIAVAELAALVIIGTLVSGSLAPAAGRNAVGYLGLLLIGLRTVGPRAAPMVPIAFVMFAALFGSGPGGLPSWWAWPAAEVNSVVSWILAMLLLGLGMGIWQAMPPNVDP